MSTKTLRPIKKGDPCYVRIQRRGKPVLAIYLEQFGNPRNKLHAVMIGDEEYHAFKKPSRICMPHECIFVAKPVGGVENEH